MSSGRCSICHTLVRTGEPATACDSCGQPYHAECWRDVGGCATYGCPRAAEARKPEPQAVVRTGWGDTKKCPACGDVIASGLLACRCGAEFPWADPMTRSEFAQWSARRNRTAASRRLLLVLFLVSLTGVLAPVAGAWAVVVARRDRADLEGADGTYLAMGWGAAAIGATHMLVLVAVFLGA